MSHAVSNDLFFIRLLGDVGIEPLTDYAVPNLPRKGWALLSYLITEPHVSHPRERLATLFWPSLPIKSARNNLRQVVLNIQRAMECQPTEQAFLVADRHSISINPNNHYLVDLLAFLQNSPECPAQPDPSYCESCLSNMEAKAALYRGEFMASFHLKDCPEFEEWLQLNREALHQRALILLERLSRCHGNFKTYRKALFFAQRYTQLEPWSETGQRQVMSLLAQSGQQSAALSQYKVCCKVLKEELGAFPEEQTRLLAKRIEKGEFQTPPQYLPISAAVPAYFPSPQKNVRSRFFIASSPLTTLTTRKKVLHSYVTIKTTALRLSRIFPGMLSGRTMVAC